MLVFGILVVVTAGSIGLGVVVGRALLGAVFLVAAALVTARPE